MARLADRKLRGVHIGLALLALSFSVAGCGASPRPSAACSPTPAADDAKWGAADLLDGGGRPRALVIARDGDPRPSVALAIAVDGGSAAAVALSAVADARLRALSFDDLAIEADGFGYRVRATVRDPEDASRFGNAVRDALLTPISGAASDLAEAVTRKLGALRLRRLEAPPLAPIVECTGELTGETAFPPAESGTSPASVSLDRVETWRRSSHVIERIAFGVVAPRATSTAIAEALRGAHSWPTGVAPAGGPARMPASDAAGVYALPGRGAQLPRLRLAVSLSNPARALVGLERAVASDGFLAAQLATLEPAWRIVDSSLTVYARHACASFTLEIDRNPSGTWIEANAARGAAIVTDAFTRQAETAAAPDPWFAVRRASDPRTAASLAAWWALSASSGSRADNADRADHGSDAAHPPSIAVALGLPPTGTNGSSEALSAFETASSSRFTRALRAARAEIAAPFFDRRVLVEQGQGDLWLLAASPCGTAGERDEDPGETAIAIMAAIATRDRQKSAADDVWVEPWITPDAIGLAAHATYVPGEAPNELASRVGRTLGRALSTPTIDNDALAFGRATLLARIGTEPSTEGRAFTTAAGALFPGHVATLAPFGSWDSLARSSRERAAVRLRALRSGPLRVAVLANTDAHQADAAVSALASWLPTAADRRRTCPPVDAVTPPARVGQLEISLGARATGGQAIVAIPLSRASAAERISAEWTVSALEGADGWLARAFGSPGGRFSAKARLSGGDRAGALVIDVRAPPDELDVAVSQVRALLQRIQKGAATASDRERAMASRERIEREQSFDSRRRLVDLWREAQTASVPSPPPIPAAVPQPSLESWRTWASTSLGEDRLVVVLARPSH